MLVTLIKIVIILLLIYLIVIWEVHLDDDREED